jgi:hypothetical protein
VRAPSDLLVHSLPRDRVEQVNVLLAQDLIVRSNERDTDLANTSHKSNNLHTKSLLQVLLSNGTSSDSANSLSSRGTASSRRRLDTVFCQVRVIGVGRARERIRLGVVVWSLVLVVDDETDGCAKGDPKFCPRLQMNSIKFGSLRSSALAV